MDEIEIVDYDSGWPAMFAAEAARLRPVFPPGLLTGIEHFGSTAIPGMAAKPIIDILVGVRSLDEARRSMMQPLHALGYVFWAENPRADRLFFVRGMPPFGARRTHHVHIAEPGSELWRNLPFRDYLKIHAPDARRYEQLKRHLAALNRHDREAYTEAKLAFIHEILTKAGLANS